MSRRQEIARALVPLVAAFPQHPFPRETAEAYASALEDVPGPVLEAAVMRLVCTATRFPTIAEIRRRCAEIALGLPSPEAAWVRLEAYRRETDEEERRRKRAVLPREALIALDAVGGLLGLDTSDNPSACRAQFLRVYEALVAERLEEASMPASWRRLELEARRAAEEWLGGRRAIEEAGEEG